MLDQLVQRAVLLLQKYEKDTPYYGCFSGGKDSCAIKELARMAKVNVEWHYHQTTIDPPELVYFIKKHHPDVIWDKPRHGNMLRRVAEKKGLPTRRARWCCEDYKERVGPKGWNKILGLRVAESAARKNRYDNCVMAAPAGRLLVLPIRLWSDENVWDFIKDYSKIPYCSLYDEGFKRLGCIGCPLTTRANREREFARWPGYERAWKRATKRLWERRAGTAQIDGREWFTSALFPNWEAMWEWWMGGKALPKTQVSALREQRLAIRLDLRDDFENSEEDSTP